MKSLCHRWSRDQPQPGSLGSFSQRQREAEEREPGDEVGYRAFSYDVTAAILVLKNNETAAMLLYQTSPVGVQLFSYRKYTAKVGQDNVKIGVVTIFRLANTSLLQVY